jgi:hypothetical protein
MSILSMEEYLVHPLDGINPKLSSKSTEYILSTPIAPELHQEISTKQLDWRLDK